MLSDPAAHARHDRAWPAGPAGGPGRGALARAGKFVEETLHFYANQCPLCLLFLWPTILQISP
jgi:hypothetical protein